MPLLNSSAGYGALAKVFHWLIALLILLQYTSAKIMLRTPAEATTLGLSQDTYYNWHKSLGLVAVLVMLARLANRRIGELPPWAPTLTPLEQRIIHRTEQLLYGALLIMPLSGFLYAMAGNYGVRLFGLWDLPNPIGPAPLTAEIALWVHVACAMLLLLPLGTHLGLVFGHHFGMRDRLIDRMLPGRTTRLRRRVALRLPDAARLPKRHRSSRRSKSDPRSQWWSLLLTIDIRCRSPTGPTDQKRALQAEVIGSLLHGAITRVSGN